MCARTAERAWNYPGLSRFERYVDGNVASIFVWLRICFEISPNGAGTPQRGQRLILLDIENGSEQASPALAPANVADVP